MQAPLEQEHQNVALFSEAFTDCRCPTCRTVLTWLPPEGIPIIDTGNDAAPPLRWTAVCSCFLTYQLTRVVQRPSDHTTPYGRVVLIEEPPHG